MKMEYVDDIKDSTSDFTVWFPCCIFERELSYIINIWIWRRY